jgi:hypothetical protein
LAGSRQISFALIRMVFASVGSILLFKLPALPMDDCLRRVVQLVALKPDVSFASFSVKYGHHLPPPGPDQVVALMKLNVSDLPFKFRLRAAVLLSRYFLFWHDKPLLIGSCPWLMKVLSHQKVNFQNLVWYQSLVLASMPLSLFLLNLYLVWRFADLCMTQKRLVWLTGMWLKFTTVLSVLALGTWIQNWVLTRLLAALLPETFGLLQLHPTVAAVFA